MLLHLRDIERLVTSHVVKNLKFISCSNIICSRDITIIDHAITITGFNYHLEAISHGYGSLFTSPFSFTGATCDNGGLHTNGFCRFGIQPKIKKKVTPIRKHQLSCRSEEDMKSCLNGDFTSIRNYLLLVMHVIHGGGGRN